MLVMSFICFVLYTQSWLWPSSIVDAFHYTVSSLVLYIFCVYAFVCACVRACMRVCLLPHLQSTLKLEYFCLRVQKRRRILKKEKKNLPLKKHKMHCSDLSNYKTFTWCAELCVNCLLHNINICKIVCIFHNGFKKECVYFYEFFLLQNSCFVFFAWHCEWIGWFSYLSHVFEPVLICLYAVFRNTVGNVRQNCY